MKDDIRIGVDIGAVTVGVAVLKDRVLISKAYLFHHGDVSSAVASICKNFDFSSARVGFTGRGAKTFSGGCRVNDVVAAVEGVRWGRRRNPRSILLLGGENIFLIRLNEDGSYSGHEINTDCASGTGVFLDQQAGRLNLTIEELSDLASRFRGNPPTIATRCAVFAKTDLIHSQQKGHSPSGIAAGLCDGVALSLAETLIKDRDTGGEICAAGGVALNGRVMTALTKILGKPISIMPHAEVIPAIGAALLAEEIIDIRDLAEGKAFLPDKNLPLNPPLRLESSTYPQFENDQTWLEGDVEITVYGELVPGRAYPVYLGLDVGSTSTKIAVNQGNDVLVGLYTYTKSAPVRAVQRLFRALGALEERHGVKFEWLAAGTTGSGRQLIGRLIHADLIINEITAHAKAAVSLDPEVDTVIEIGGQDSKFIRVQNGSVVQAIMNYICAAGTGSFIEEQAKKLNVPLAEYAGLAMGQRGPVISDRCTVYMERDLSRLLAEGWRKEELLASVLHSIRDNYLMRVVGQAKIGRRVCFQGATAKNKALVAAFEGALQQPIRVSRFCHLAGAYGVCLQLGENRPAKSDFVGLDFSSWSSEQRSETCSLCRNRCLITVVEVGEERAAWGFQCGREYEDAAYREKPLPFESLTRIYERAVGSPLETDLPAPSRKETIGIPRALPLVEYLPLWERFFARLGFPIIISPQDKEILKRGKRVAQADFCVPLFLAHGHVDWLREKSADFIFFPIMLHGPRRQPKVKRNFFCYYTSYTPVIIRNSPAFQKKANLLSPLIDLQVEIDRIVPALHEALGRPLRLTKKAIRRAFEESWEDFLRSRERLREEGDRVVAELERQDAFGIVLLGRPYNLLDRSLNHDIPVLIQKAGVRVLTQDMMRLEDIVPRYTGDYLSKVHWHYGKRIIQATEAILQHSQLFPVFVTNFRCSPDAFLMSYFKELMERQRKPYLILQLDELSSEVGYETRIEAALESFRNWVRREPTPVKPFTFLPLRRDRVWLIPHLDDAGTVLARAVFERFGFEARVAEETPESIVQGLKLVGGGECIPVAAILGSIVETVSKHGLESSRTAAVIPTSFWSCNFPQIPLAVQTGLNKVGLGDIKIFTTAVDGQKFALPLNLALMKSYIMTALIHQMAAAVRPLEVKRGETDEAKKTALEKLSRAIVEKQDCLDAFREVVGDFRAIKKAPPDGSRPRLVILGDLYLICNSQFNRNVEKAIEAAGGLAVPSSFIDLTYIGQLNKIEKSLKERDYAGVAEAKAMNAFVRFHDLQFRKAASPILDGVYPIMDGSLLKDVRRIGIPPELEGETAQNAMKVFYYLRHLRPDGFVHINPLYCCPGAVSHALLSYLERTCGVPVIHLFYDGLNNPNENLEPYIFYLRRKIEAGADTPSLGDEKLRREIGLTPTQTKNIV
jgi:predicted CoA-substrate-specific enzyme activase